MEEFDAVVIGAGNAGLTAAAALQLSGQRTLLLERHNIPGGCATSFVRGEFEFEVALHQLSGLGPQDKPFVMRQMFQSLGIMDKVEFVQEHELYRYVVPGEIDITLPASWSGLRDTLKTHFRHEAAGIDRFLALCEGIATERFAILPEIAKRNDPELLKARCPLFAQYGMQPASEILDELFTSQAIRSVVGAYWCYLGLPPSQLPFADLAMVLYAYATFKPWHVKGGSQALSNALLESFLNAGGSVQFNCAAQRIETEHGRVCAVHTEHGARIACDIVISNASSVVTYHDLLDGEAPPEVVRQDFRSRRIGTSAFVLYIGLDCPPEQLGIPCASSFICNHLDEEKAYARMKTLDAPEHTMLTCYNIDDPDFAPSGKSVVSLVCLQYGAAWDDVAADDYFDTKYALADQLLLQAEQVYPGLRAHIEQMEVATPKTMMRYLNTPGGAIYGFEQNAADSPLVRGHINVIPGLYLAGSWTSMGGFQPTYMAGFSAAEIALKARHNAEESAHA
ncbi:NAD(P)/FAD-dependent oxidoreductase [Ferrimonas pelagia]|uniref:FAD-dependent oxidoreductase n=1 Tax=Ferrimonas pelagia TaxID=1177826 RepID=A0ABP9EZ08_9GAMM